MSLDRTLPRLPFLSAALIGSLLAFAAPAEAGPRVHAKEKKSLKNVKQLTRDGVKSGEAYFSPDGQRLAFFTQNPTVLRVVSLGGDPPITVADEGLAVAGVSWSSDGYLYVDTPTGGIGRVPENGGDVEPVTTLEELDRFCDAVEEGMRTGVGV